MKKSQFFLVTLFWVALGSSVLAQTQAVEPVLQDFRTWAQTQGFGQADVQDLNVTDDYITQHNQVRHIYVQQAYQGIGIVNSNAAIHVWKGKVVARHEKLVKGLSAKAAPPQPSLTATEALRKLTETHNWRMPAKLEVLSLAKGIEQKGKFGPNEIAYEAIPFQLVYYADKKGKLHLGWNFQVHATQSLHYYNSIVDAKSGEILFEEDWVLKCNVENHNTDEANTHMDLFDEGFMYGPRVNSKELANMMTPQYRVLAIPTESPNHGPFVLVQDPSDTTASPFGWHDTDGIPGPEYTITRGNNVYASEDRDADDVPGFSPDGGTSLNFDFLYNSSIGAHRNTKVVITNLFYMTNIMHDVWYRYGFDEHSGNFQENNYGRGGIGSDAIRADAQDGLLLSTAYFISTPDGETPVIGMAIWPNGGDRDPPFDSLTRDSGLDNGIIAHEYGHGISNRLTGGPANVRCLENEEQPGEGWSDWFGLVMQVKPGDTGADVKGIASYSAGYPPDSSIRDFPYSTDMSISPYTYDHVRSLQVRNSLQIPHAVGSVMCAMLWDLYWAMTDEYGYDDDIYHGTGGNNMAMQLVMDGMKLQPCSPGFVDVRDAILLADSINYGAANQRLIWEVFARRGLGASADQGYTFLRSDGVEAFDLPDRVKEILYMEKKSDKYSVENGDTLTFTFIVRNQKTSPLSNVIVTDTLANDFAYLPNSSTVAINLVGQVLQINLGDLAPEQDATFSFQVLVNSDKPFILPDFEDDMEGDVSTYRNQRNLGNVEWRTSTDNSRSPSTSWFAENVGAQNDQSLIMPIFTPTESSVLFFWHYFDTDETWDGGVVELLTANGTTDLGDKMFVNGYNSSVQQNNPIGARAAFSGKSAGWIQTKIDLAEFAGNPSAIAFRFGSDDSTFEEGWYIDDIVVQNGYTAMNTATVRADEGDTYVAHLERPVSIRITEIVNSIRELPQEVALKLFPNPAKQEVSLEYLGTSLEVLEIEFRNTLGQIVKAIEMEPFANQTSKRIDIRALPVGIYYVSIQQGTNRTIKKLLVE